MNYVQASITFVTHDFCLAKANGNTYYLSSQNGPMGFTPNDDGKAEFNGEFVNRNKEITRGLMLVINPGEYSPQHQKTKAVNWGLVSDARAAEASFVKPETYVVYRRRRNTAKSRWSERAEAFRGSINQMIKKFGPRAGQRHSVTDELAPLHETVGGFQFENTFARVSGGKEVMCGDPRPFDKTGPQYRAVRLIEGCEPRGLASGSLEQICFEYPRTKRGQDTLRPGQDFEVQWYRQGANSEWQEVSSDPRPFDSTKEAVEEAKGTVDFCAQLAAQMTGKFAEAA